MSIVVWYLNGMAYIEVPDHWTDKDYGRMISKVKELDNGCLLWTGSRNKEGRGYALFNIDGKTRVLHVYLWRQLLGEYEGHLDHLCRNMGCINLACLEPVTPRENVVVRGTGITAHNARKTKCPQGHEYSGTNSQGKRICRVCTNEAAKRWKQRTGYRS
jgi:hypothetical protein